MARANSYEGICRSCGTTVKAAAGYIKQNERNGKWDTYHHACPEASDTTKAPAVDSDAMGSAVDRVIDLMAKRFEELVPGLVAANLDKLSKVAEIKLGDKRSVKLDDRAHVMLPTIVTAVCAGVHPFLVGPAGSGKTTLAEQVAKVMDLKFGFASRVTSEYKLLGFIDAQGNVVRTAFRECYEHGGVFLLDEIDASDADAVTSFNAALSNGMCDFPDAVVRKHDDFYAIAAGNTFGRGADRQYVGRNQLDAATLDRFAIFEVDYDNALEADLSGDREWASYVQAIRAAIMAQQVRHIVSPRASITGARLLAAGMAVKEVEEAVIWKGLDAATRQRVQSSVGRTYDVAA